MQACRRCVLKQQLSDVLLAACVCKADLGWCSLPLPELQAGIMQVEWTRDLHDKFVSAVEALSVDKAVPSKILERMGSCSEGLTRQNIASHLQKYRNR